MPEKLLKFFKILDKPLWGLSFYFIVCSVLLWNNSGTSFVDDSLEWIVSFKKQGWEAYLHSYDMTSVYWFHDFFSNIMHIIFGKNNFAWYFVILFFHTSASYFLYKYLSLIFTECNKNNAQILAFLSSLTFLLGAYNTENIFWIATYHYEVTIMYLFVSLYYIARFKGIFQWKKHWWIIALFPFMLTMHEMSFFFPFAFIFTILFYRSGKAANVDLGKDLLKVSIPFAFISILILICTKLIKGSFIPHYGISHVQDHSVYGFLYTLVNYLIKHLLFIHNFSFQIREKFYDVDPKSMYVLFAAVACIMLFVIYKIRNQIHLYKDYILLTALLLVFYFPVSNMYFFWHFPIQNDRLFYFPSAFLYSLLVAFAMDILNKAGLFFVSSFIILNFLVLRIHIHKIEESIHFTEEIVIPSYEPYLHMKPVILNMPYNYNGFYSFRKIFRFRSAMFWAYDKDIDFVYTASMPFFRPTDSVTVSREYDSVFRISLHAPGSWLMREAFGGSDYENEEVKVDYSDDNQSAIIHLKKHENGQPILYCTGNRGFVRIQ